MASTPFYDAQFTAGEKLTAARLNAEQAALQAEFERRSSHLTGFVPASGAPTLAIVGTTVTCTDLDVLLSGVRLTTSGTWDLSDQWQYDDTYYLELDADNGYQLEVSHQSGQIQIGTVVMTSGVLSSLTVTVTAFADSGAGGAGDMSKSVYDADDDGKVDTAALADAVVADGVTGAMLHPDVAGDGLVQDASGNLDVDVDGATIVIAQSGKLAVPASGIGTAHIANDAVIPAHLSSADTPVAGDYVRIASDGSFEFGVPAAGTGDMRRAVYDTDNDGIVDHAALANSVPANAISSYQIADGSVIEDKIGTYAVTEDKIATGAVTANKIEDGSITDIKISPDGISGSRIAANSIPVDTLAALGAQKDEDVLTYNSSYNKFEWVSNVTRNTHDHTEGAGGQIPADGIASGAITAAKLQPASTPNDGQLLAYASTGTTLAWVDPPTAGLGEEAVRDLMGSTLVAGTNVTVTVDDVANTITIAATGGSGGGLTAEEVHDQIDAHVVGTTDQIVATASDVDDTLTLSLAEAVTESLSAADGHVAVVAGNPHGTTYADTGGAAADHDHDEDYAAAGHDHDEDYIAISLIGADSGVASLGADGKVPSEQLPEGTGGGGSATLAVGFIILAPSNQSFPLIKLDQAVTITRLSALLLDGTNVIGGLDTIMGSDATFEPGATEITSFTAPNVDAGDWISWHTTSASGYVSSLSVTIEYEVTA